MSKKLTQNLRKMFFKIFEKDKERLFLESKSKPISKISTISRKYFLFFRILIESSDINYKVFVIFGREKISVWHLRGTKLTTPAPDSEWRRPDELGPIF